MLFVVILLSFVPDLDVFPGLLLGDLHGIHNGVANSLLVGALAALVVTGLMWLIGRVAIRQWFAVTLIGYWLHVIMDYLAAERGVMLFWPLTSERLISPVRLFYGFHYSEGLISIRHLWTAVTELLFAAALLLVISLVSKLASMKRGTHVA